MNKWLLTCQIVKESSACYENYGETLGGGGQALQVTESYGKLQVFVAEVTVWAMLAKWFIHVLFEKHKS